MEAIAAFFANVAAAIFLVFDDDIGQPEQHNNEQRRIPKVENFVRAVVPLYDHDTFQQHFRLSRSQFENLLVSLGPYFIPDLQKTSLETTSLVSLWVLANQDSYRDIGDRFGICKATVSNIVHRFCKLVSENLENVISWPNDGSSILTVAQFNRLGFPNTLGAIDGCHIKIDKPCRNNVPNPDNFYNRKSCFSTNLLAVCNANQKFTYVFAGAPGKLHDARVLRISSLGLALQEYPHDIFPHGTHIIGDSAFPLTNFIMTPFKDNGHLTRVQTQYNNRLSSVRCVIERAFGLLKSRFRRLRYLQMHKLQSITQCIKTCCILHNLCLDNPIQLELDEEEDEDLDFFEDNPCEVRRGRGRQLVIAKRNAIAASFE